MEPHIRAILIDDEEDSLIAIEEQIKMYCPSVEIIGTHDDPAEGLKAIKELNPNLVFLDIDMPIMTGLELARKIESDEVHIIFVTAHLQYAIHAIKLSALDYILKPVDPDELIAAVEKAKKLISDKQFKDPNRLQVFDDLINNIQKESFSQETKIRIPEAKGIYYVKIKEILRLEAEANYCRFYFVDGSNMIVSKNLGTYKESLKNYKVVQAHRSHLVNKEHVRRYVRIDGPYVVMSDNTKVPVSKNFKDNF